MTATQAIDLLDSVAGNVQATRTDHAMIQQAVTVLRATIAVKLVDQPLTGEEGHVKPSDNGEAKKRRAARKQI